MTHDLTLDVEQYTDDRTTKITMCAAMALSQVKTNV